MSTRPAFERLQKAMQRELPPIVTLSGSNRLRKFYHGRGGGGGEAVEKGKNGDLVRLLKAVFGLRVWPRNRMHRGGTMEA